MSNEFYLKNIYEYKYFVFHKSNIILAKLTLSIIAKKIELLNLKEQDTKDISGNYYIFDIIYISLYISISIFLRSVLCRFEPGSSKSLSGFTTEICRLDPA